ncbi:hypothetical protein XENTR_v10011414 [Xenopus tropicalis]|nr:hypothetical protein XENTR_v10011414 [Xenopus tropicalis]
MTPEACSCRKIQLLILLTSFIRKEKKTDSQHKETTVLCSIMTRL